MTTEPVIHSRLHFLLRLVLGAWVIVLVLALFPYTADPAAPIKHLVTSYALLIMAFLWLAAVLFAQDTARFTGPSFILLAVFLAINALAALLSDFPANSLNALRPWIMFSLIALFAAQACREWKQVRRLMMLIIAAVTTASLYGFFQAAGWDPFPWVTKGIEEYKGLPSTFANPNFAGHALVLAIPLAAGLLIERWRIIRTTPALPSDTPKTRPWELWQPMAALALALLLMGTHLYCTHMRGGRIALIAAGLAVLLHFMLRKRFHPVKAGFLACTALMLLAACGAAILFLGARHAGKEPALSMDSSLVLRLNGYHGACRMMMDHPLLGIGVGNYATENMPYWTSYEKRWFITEGKKNYHVHCDLIEAGVDAGIPGSTLYLALLLWALLASFALASPSAPSQRAGYMLAACFTAFAVDGLFGFNLRVPVSAGLFFLLIGMLEASRGAPHAGLASRSANLVLALALLLIAGLCTFFETRAFLGERCYQRANGAQYWAADAAQKGGAQKEARLFEAGYALLNQARQYLPWDPRLPEAQGQIDLKLRRPAQAITRFNEALARHPDHPGILISLAQAHVNNALTCLSEAAGKNPLENASFLDNLDRAEAAGRRAAELCEGLPEAYEALGRAAFLRATALQNGHQDASAALTETEKQLLQALHYGTPNRAAVQRILAQLYVKLNRPEEAEHYFKLAVESEPADQETWRLFRLFAQQQNRAAACMDALNRAYGRLKKAHPFDKETFVLVTTQLIELYAGTDQDHSLAEQLIQDALARVPDRLDLWGLHARLQPPEDRFTAIQSAWKNKTGKETSELMTAVAGMDPASPDSFTNALKLLAQAAEKRAKDASPAQSAQELGWLLDLMLKQLETSPMPPESKAMLLVHSANTCCLMDRWEDANRQLVLAIPRLAPAEQSQAHAVRAEALTRLKRPEEALKAAREAVRLAPNNAAFRWNLARHLAASGKYSEAKFEYISLLQNTAKTSPAYAALQKEMETVEQKRNTSNTTGPAL